MTPPRTAVDAASTPLPVDRTSPSTAVRLPSAAPAAAGARPGTAPSAGRGGPELLVTTRHPDPVAGTVAASSGWTTAPPAARAVPDALPPHTPSHRTDHPSR